MSKLRDLLGSSAHLYNRSTQVFLNFLLENGATHMNEEVLTLMREVRRALKARDYNAVQGQKSLYLMIRGGVPEAQRFLQGLGADNIVLKVMLDSMQDGIDLASLAAFGSNCLT